MFYGDGISEADAQHAEQRFIDACPEAEVSLLPGGQPVRRGEALRKAGAFSPPDTGAHRMMAERESFALLSYQRRNTRK